MNTFTLQRNSFDRIDSMEGFVIISLKGPLYYNENMVKHYIGFNHELSTMHFYEK